MKQRTPNKFVEASRDALVTALLAAGPNQPTLCEGWQTQHLAAHIYLRESSPMGAGMYFSSVSRRFEARTMQLGDAASSNREYLKLVHQIATGPQPVEEPGRFDVLNRMRQAATERRRAADGDLIEFFVHTEDIRRAQPRWAPRKLSTEYADALFADLREHAKDYYKHAKTGYILVRSNGERIEAKKGSEYTYVTGPAGELVLHALGRHDYALVLIDKA